jgi:hypothetical protein
MVWAPPHCRLLCSNIIDELVFRHTQVISLYPWVSFSKIFLEEFTTRSWLERVASALLMLHKLIPLIAFEEVEHTLGAGRLCRTLFGRTDGEAIDDSSID